jgi:hypothetical protein
LAAGCDAIPFWAIHAKAKAANSWAALTFDEDNKNADKVSAYEKCIQFNDIRSKTESYDRMIGPFFPNFQ